jgi:hypothetical protein
MSSTLRRIHPRQWTVIQDIARTEGRDPKNVLDLLIDRGLAARSLGNWPTPVREQSNNVTASAGS